VEIVRKKVPGHQADNRERPTVKQAAMMSWNDELIVAGRAKTLTAGDIILLIIYYTHSRNTQALGNACSSE